MKKTRKRQRIARLRIARALGELEMALLHPTKLFDESHYAVFLEALADFVEGHRAYAEIELCENNSGKTESAPPENISLADQLESYPCPANAESGCIGKCCFAFCRSEAQQGSSKIDLICAYDADPVAVVEAVDMTPEHARDIPTVGMLENQKGGAACPR